MTNWIKELKDIYNDFKWFPGKRPGRHPDRWTDSVPLPVLILLGRLYY